MTVYPLTGAWAQCVGGGDHHTLTPPLPDPRHDTPAGGHDGAAGECEKIKKIYIILHQGISNLLEDVLHPSQ